MMLKFVKPLVAGTAALVSCLLTQGALADVQGNIAVTYSAMHSLDYPLDGTNVDADALAASIDTDFEFIAQYFTHTRTFYSQFYGVNVGKYAHAHGVKLHLGIYMTTESWIEDEIQNAVDAVQNYEGTVEAIMVGNENLGTFTATDILNIVSEVKERLGDELALTVKFGTVQTITSYLSTDSSLSAQVQQLADGLDVLGVNIYPFFNNNYDSNDRIAILESNWNSMVTKFTADKILLTETGYPTAGSSSSLAPDVYPSLDESIAYFSAVKAWSPPGAPSKIKYWFDIFDRRPDDNTMGVDYEQHFGIFDYLRQPKGDYDIELLSTTSSSNNSTSTDTEDEERSNDSNGSDEYTASPSTNNSVTTDEDSTDDNSSSNGVVSTGNSASTDGSSIINDSNDAMTLPTNPSPSTDASASTSSSTSTDDASSPKICNDESVVMQVKA